ncbi:MAG: hypothetical protein ACREK6_09020, partial [Candidatus Rokuibacteriota bacterium]
GLSILTTWGLSVLTARGLSILTTWSLSILTARGLSVLTTSASQRARGLHIPTTRSLGILTARGLSILTARSLGILTTSASQRARGLDILSLGHPRLLCQHLFRLRHLRRASLRFGKRGEAGEEHHTHECSKHFPHRLPFPSTACLNGVDSLVTPSLPAGTSHPLRSEPGPVCSG